MMSAEDVGTLWEPAAGEFALPHRLICSENFAALTQLVETEAETFDFIYIDPPYNTGREFTFSDRTAGAQRSSSRVWLDMMTPRVQLAHRLLSHRGVMCVSIDDRELPHLTLLLREVFGEENQIAVIKWKKKRKPSFLRSHMTSVFEYILVFAKCRQEMPRLLGERSTELSRPVLNQGNPLAERIIPRGTPARCDDGVIPKGQRRLRTLTFELKSDLVIRKGHVLQDCGVVGPFRVSQEILNDSLFITAKGGLRRSISEDEQVNRLMTDDGSAWSTNEDADREIMELFGQRVFQYAKPTGMLRRLIRMYPAPGRSQLTQPLRFLDFFAGSGSFGDAILQQNAADGVPRVFTLIQSAEPCQKHSEFENIFELMRERIRRVASRLPERFQEPVVDTIYPPS